MWKGREHGECFGQGESLAILILTLNDLMKVKLYEVISCVALIVAVTAVSIS